MIARVAEHCFWLTRHIERTENTARLLQVNLSFLLDVALPVQLRWRPVLLATGEDSDFRGEFGDAGVDDGEAVQAYMVWDQRNPVALVNSVFYARENARTIRETISLEMWQSVNAFWLWLTGGVGRRMYDEQRHAFYEQVKEYCQLFHGQYHTTMLFDQPFDFMGLGSLMERTDQTARLVAALLSRVEFETPTGHAQAAAAWLAMLRSCSAVESFAKRNHAPTAIAVIGFLLQEAHFPRAVRYCLERSRHFLERLRDGSRESLAIERLDEVLEPLRLRTAAEILYGSLPGELARILAGVAQISDAIRQEYFTSPPVLSGQPR